jgi:hypothetical protein
MAMGFITAGMSSPSLSAFGAAGFLGGVCLILASRFFVQTTLSMIPLAAAAGLMLRQWKEIAMHSYVGVEVGCGIAIVMLLVAGRVWSRKLEK